MSVFNLILNVNSPDADMLLNCQILGLQYVRQCRGVRVCLTPFLCRYGRTPVNFVFFFLPVCKNIILILI